MGTQVVALGGCRWLLACPCARRVGRGLPLLHALKSLNRAFTSAIMVSSPLPPPWLPPLGCAAAMRTRTITATPGTVVGSNGLSLAPPYSFDHCCHFALEARTSHTREPCPRPDAQSHCSGDCHTRDRSPGLELETSPLPPRRRSICSAAAPATPDWIRGARICCTC